MRSEYDVCSAQQPLYSRGLKPQLLPPSLPVRHFDDLTMADGDRTEQSDLQELLGDSSADGQERLRNVLDGECTDISY